MVNDPPKKPSDADAAPSTGDRYPEKPVAEELERVLRSATFQQADRLKRFLTFIVGEATGGRGTELKEYVIGVQVFRKEDSFDPRTDPIVRVQARRLRAKLVRYYREEGRSDAIVIELPKGRYVSGLPVAARSRCSTHRSVGTTLVSRNTITVLAVRGPQRRWTASRPSAGASGKRSCITSRGCRAQDRRGPRRTFGKSWTIRRPPTRPRRSSSAAASANLAIALRMGVHLIDGASGCYLWSESIDATLSDIFAAQAKVGEAIARKLEPNLGDERRFAGVGLPAENLAAQNLYLQGRYHLNQRTDEGLRKALDFFERALAEDAQYALAHSGLADAYGLLAHYGVLGPAEVWTKAASRAAVGRHARRHVGRGAHVARPREGHAGLGLGGRRA